MSESWRKKKVDIITAQFCVVKNMKKTQSLDMTYVPSTKTVETKGDPEYVGDCWFDVPEMRKGWGAERLCEVPFLH